MYTTWLLLCLALAWPAPAHAAALSALAPAQDTPATAQPAPPPPDPAKVIYLTFDDGPSGFTQPLLDLLARHNAKATFFVLGRQAAGRQDLLRAIYAAGHGLGNHTYNHPSLAGLSTARFDNEVVSTAQVLGDLDHGCLRPPYGALSKAARANAAALGYNVVMWNVDPRDWSRPGAGVIADRVIRRAAPNAVVVLHDGGGDRTQTLAAVETILTVLGAQGYTFAALCRDGAPSIPPPLLAQAPPPPVAWTSSTVAPAAAEAPPPPPGPADNNALLAPKPDAVVKGQVTVRGIANHPTFRKWQLDLLLNGQDETFLALGEIPVPDPTDLTVWDTTKYPNGKHILRLRVVYEGLNYSEYLVPVTVDNP